MSALPEALPSAVSSASFADSTAARSIEPGTLVILEAAKVPDGILFESHQHRIGWRTFTPSAVGDLGKDMASAGWHLFFMAAELKATSWGKSGQATTCRALAKILKPALDSRFNCIEVTRVASKRFLGIPYTTVGAHARHLQIGNILD